MPIAPLPKPKPRPPQITGTGGDNFGTAPRLPGIGGGNFGKAPGLPSDGIFQPISHMPKGATQSPKGDLGRRRVAESDAQRGFKNRGGSLSGSGAFGSAVSEPGKIGEKN